MLVFDQMNILSIKLGKDLDAQFRNNIWSASIHYGNTFTDKNVLTIKGYNLTIRLTTHDNMQMVNSITKYMTEKYNIISPELNKDELGYLAIEYSDIPEETLLYMDTLFRMC